MTPKEAITKILDDLNKLEQHWKVLDAPDYVGQAYRDAYRSALRVVEKHWKKVVIEPRTVAEIRAEVERLRRSCQFRAEQDVSLDKYYCGQVVICKELLNFINGKEG